MEVEEGRLTWFHQINRPSAEMCTIWRNGARIWRNGGRIWRNGDRGRPIELAFKIRDFEGNNPVLEKWRSGRLVELAFKTREFEGDYSDLEKWRSDLEKWKSGKAD
ncbi:hypothetical protein SLEP1_g57024 [Rubroshorea leprosula]|uniref:Uncharacterized protein n=1 Tax=Rubroshorea leprosula TaxID=152421 RepID=A0AAV5MLB2_9ROSI|nr:hypothetical protein SLEP1_g57024 [Rubroshorea leprosula]